MTCWFEPLILRLGPRSSRYDVICRGYTYGEGHDNWCLIQGERSPRREFVGGRLPPMRLQGTRSKGRRE